MDREISTYEEEEDWETGFWCCLWDGFDHVGGCDGDHFDFVIWSLFEEMVFWIILARKDVE